MVRSDALGIHELGLYKLDEALHLTTEWLPKRPRADDGERADAAGVVADSERSALLTVTRYITEGSEEVAGSSSDLVLARRDGRLHSFARDPSDRSSLVPSEDDKNVDDRLADL